MDRFVPSRLGHALFPIPLIWVILWLGIAALTVALVVLIRSSWGQSRPLRKCAVLSILTHALLACLATTVQIMADASGPTRYSPIRVSIVSAKEDQPRPTESPADVEPWAAISQDLLAEPTVTPPNRSDLRLKDPREDTTVDDSLDSARQLVANSTAPDLRQLSDPTALNDPSAEEPLDSPFPAESLPAARSDQQLTVEPHAFAPQASPVRDADTKLRSEADTSLAEHAADTTGLPESSLEEEDITEKDTIKDISRKDTPTETPKRPTGVWEAERRIEKIASHNNFKLTPIPLASNVDPGSVIDADPSKPTPESTVESRSDGQPLAIYRHRYSEERKRMVDAHGGSARTEAAVDAALLWLAANQSGDGHWDAKRHGAGQEQSVMGQDRQHAGIHADTGISGLALLAFLGAGQTHLEGEHKTVVRNGLNYLMRIQGIDGSIAGNARTVARMYCHAMATFSINEAYAMTGDHRLEEVVRRAVGYSVRAQHAATGGWRYQPGQNGDTSQLGWQLMALRSAELGGLRLPAETFPRTHRFLQSVSAGHYGGLASYQTHRAPSRTMTAEALVCRLLSSMPRDRLAEQEAVQFLLGELPGEGRPNLYYWYYATIAVYQLQGEPWQRWNQALKQTLLAAQEVSGSLAGSWDADTVWGGYGGRVYSTAMATLSLEIYYRYLPLYEEVARQIRTPYR